MGNDQRPGDNSESPEPDVEGHRNPMTIDEGEPDVEGHRNPMTIDEGEPDV